MIGLIPPTITMPAGSYTTQWDTTLTSLPLGMKDGCVPVSQHFQAAVIGGSGVTPVVSH
jgi:hypothetical protein